MIAVLAAGGCAQGPSESDPNAPLLKTESPAASLRQGLDYLLQEHIDLVCSATDAALAGRDDEFTAANNAMDDNTRELSGAFGHIYGEAAGRSFYNLWHTHDGLIVDYTLAVAGHKQADQDKAVTSVIAFAREFGTFMETTTGSHLKRDTAAEQVRTIFAEVQSVIESQAAKDYARAYLRQRDAEKFVAAVGNNWADAIVQQFPDKY
jgi:hypothetical protein